MSLPTRRPPKGVRIVGSGSALPARSLSNQDLMKVMETSDDWIRQRTGITSRQVYSPDNGETTASLATTAVNNALADAGMKSDELDLIVAATMTPDMPTPSVACQTAAALGCHEIGAFDINAACSGFVFSLNMVHEYIRGGRARNVALVGVDTITQFIDYSTYGRGAAILFGDAAGAVIDVNGAAVVLREREVALGVGRVIDAVIAEAAEERIRAAAAFIEDIVARETQFEIGRAHV